MVLQIESLSNLIRGVTNWKSLKFVSSYNKLKVYQIFSGIDLKNKIEKIYAISITYIIYFKVNQNS